MSERLRKMSYLIISCNSTLGEKNEKWTLPLRSSQNNYVICLIRKNNGRSFCRLARTLEWRLQDRSELRLRRLIWEEETIFEKRKSGLYHKNTLNVSVPKVM